MAIPTVAERLGSFLRTVKPNAYCAPCLAKSLGLAQWYAQEAEATATAAMSDLPRSAFARATAQCSRCGKRTVVVWAAGGFRAM